MSGDVHVRFCERLGVRFPWATHLVILVSGGREQAEHEKAQLADYLRKTAGLELSEEKTRISDLSEGFEFLGHRVRHKWHPRFGLMPRIEIPTRRRADVRYMVKQLTKRALPPSHYFVCFRSSIQSSEAGAITTDAVEKVIVMELGYDSVWLAQ